MASQSKRSKRTAGDYENVDIYVGAANLIASDENEIDTDDLSLGIYNTSPEKAFQSRKRKSRRNPNRKTIDWSCPQFMMALCSILLQHRIDTKCIKSKFSWKKILEMLKSHEAFAGLEDKLKIDSVAKKWAKVVEYVKANPTPLINNNNTNTNNPNDANWEQLVVEFIKLEPNSTSNISHRSAFLVDYLKRYDDNLLSFIEEAKLTDCTVEEIGSISLEVLAYEYIDKHDSLDRFKLTLIGFGLKELNACKIYAQFKRIMDAHYIK